MNEIKNSAGYAINFLPEVCSFGYEAKLKTTPNLSKPDYASTIGDTGETHVVRVYTEDHKGPLVVLSRNLVDLSIPEKYRESAIESLDEATLRQVFDNNRQVLRMHGVPEYSKDAVLALIYAVPIEAFLARYWYILKQTELKQISEQNFFGISDTDIGKFPLKSL